MAQKDPGERIDARSAPGSNRRGNGNTQPPSSDRGSRGKPTRELRARRDDDAIGRRVNNRDRISAAATAQDGEVLVRRRRESARGRNALAEEKKV